MNPSNQVQNPIHYTGHASGLQAWDITSYYSGNLAAAFKYMWRLGKKDATLQELDKAKEYLEREIRHRNGLVMQDCIRPADPPTIKRLEKRIQKVCRVEVGHRLAYFTHIHVAYQHPDKVGSIKSALLHLKEIRIGFEREEK